MMSRVLVWSRPLREGVGRNQAFCKFVTALVSVALYARAWVEMGLQLSQNRLPSVALYARAWVEI